MTSRYAKQASRSTRTEAEAAAERCPECKGRGYVTVDMGQVGGLPVSRAETCPTCGGSGKRNREDGE